MWSEWCNSQVTERSSTIIIEYCNQVRNQATLNSYFGGMVVLLNFHFIDLSGGVSWGWNRDRDWGIKTSTENFQFLSAKAWLADKNFLAHLPCSFWKEYIWLAKIIHKNSIPKSQWNVVVSIAKNTPKKSHDKMMKQSITQSNANRNLNVNIL